VKHNLRIFRTEIAAYELRNLVPQTVTMCSLGMRLYITDLHKKWRPDFHYAYGLLSTCMLPPCVTNLINFLLGPIITVIKLH